jgi:Na+-translocating ferredoxin:NAD+ oxidoreductase RnfC subunit
MRRLNQKWTGKMDIKVHPLREGRRVPIKALARKLHVEQYDVPAPFRKVDLAPRQLKLMLKQHAGAPAQPTVKAGDQVTAGQIIAEPAPKALGAIIHAPLAGRISEVNSEAIFLKVL